MKHKEERPITSLALVMVSAMMLAAPGSSVTGMNGREEAEEAEGVTAEGVTASSEMIWFKNTQEDASATWHTPHILQRPYLKLLGPFGMFQILQR